MWKNSVNQYRLIKNKIKNIKAIYIIFISFCVIKMYLIIMTAPISAVFTAMKVINGLIFYLHVYVYMYYM